MSRLFGRMAEPCVALVPVREADGEGGARTVWAEGDAFDAAIVRDTSLAARVAEREGLSGTFTVTSVRELAFHDAFRRVSDGRTFRVTGRGRDGAAPGCASFSFFQCPAEEWEVPDA